MATHTHSQKPSSSWTPAATKIKGFTGPHPFPDLAKPNSQSFSLKEIPAYSSKAAYRLHANVMDRLQAKAREEANLSPISEQGKEELDSSHSPELEQGEKSTTFSPTTGQGNPFLPCPIIQKAAAVTVQRLCSECEQERGGQQEEEEKSSSRGLIQPKLTISEPGDKYEQEADRVAKQFVQRINRLETAALPLEPGKTLQKQPMISVLQRMRESEKQMQLQHEQTMLQNQSEFWQRIARQAVKASVPNVQADFETTLNRAKGGGSPLDNAFRAKIEPAMGADFSGVRVHTDAEADRLSQSIQAKAFTTGDDIFFRQGEYEPGSKQGQELLAHELTHVVQQNNSGNLNLQFVQRKSRYATEPPNCGALDKANEVVREKLKAEGDMNPNRKLTMKPQDAKYRTLWMDTYIKHGGKSSPKDPHLKQGALSNYCKKQQEKPSYQRKNYNRRIKTPEARWENAHPEGYIEKLSSKHYILWNFSVGKASLKPEFKKILDEIAKNWQIIDLAGTGRIVIEGHASSSDSERLNRRISWRRAVRVASYLWSRKAHIPWERITIEKFGEKAPRFPNINPFGMARNRRVEIKILNPYTPTPIAEQDVPPDPTKPKPQPRSKSWKCRIVGSAGGGIFYGGSVFGLEIVDLTNNLSMHYEYRGGAFTLGPGVSVGLSGASPGTDWQKFSTSIPIRIQDFKGPARHTSVGIQYKRGVSIEYIHLFGPALKGADSVYLRWWGIWEKGYSVGAGTDIGPLEPMKNEKPTPVDPGYK